MQSSACILVVDDEEDIRETIRDILADEGYTVILAENAVSAREARRLRRPDLILLDIWMPDSDGISLLREWNEGHGLNCPVIMMSGHGTIQTAVEATRLGAYDFIEKPISLAKLLLAIQHAREAFSLQHENQHLKQQLPATYKLIGNSRALQQLRTQIERLVHAKAPVLLIGESGTGKEAIARILHKQNQREQQAFITVPFASIPKSTLPTLLLGSEQGDTVHYGYLDQSQGGTLYLDSIVDMDIEQQRVLSGVLANQQFVRLNGRQPIPLDVRVVASMTQSPEEALQSQKLHPDLFYQLNVCTLRVPALRERLDDLPDLLNYAIDYFMLRDGVPYRRFTIAAQNRLRQYQWPGNLRELNNWVQRLLIMGGGDIEPEELEPMFGLSLNTTLAVKGRTFAIDYTIPLRDARDAFERAYFLQLLKETDGSVGKLAIMAGMERTHLYRKLRDLGINLKERHDA